MITAINWLWNISALIWLIFVILTIMNMIIDNLEKANKYCGLMNIMTIFNVIMGILKVINK